MLNPITDVIHSRCFAAADFWHVANRCSRAWMIWATGRADMDEIDAHMMRGRYVHDAYYQKIREREREDCGSDIGIICVIVPDPLGHDKYPGR